MNTHLTVAFDVDGTLRDAQDAPRYDVINLFLTYQKLGCTMVIWSGSGVDYANIVKAKLGLDAIVLPKGSAAVDIAVDDSPDCRLGRVNIRV